MTYIYMYVVAVVAVFGTGKTVEDGSKRAEWTKIFTNLMMKHTELYDSKDFEAVASEYEADGHHLVPGMPAFIGRAAIENSYHELFANLSAVSIDKIDLRFACGDWAVAEIHFHHALTTVKSLIVAKMEEDGVAKISISIHNMDN